MKFKALTIRRTESYQTPANTLQGTVDLVGDTGAQTITLSAGAIINILAVIQKEVEGTAKYNAKLAHAAMMDAAGELQLTANPFVAPSEE